MLLYKKGKTQYAVLSDLMALFTSIVIYSFRNIKFVKIGAPINERAKQ